VRPGTGAPSLPVPGIEPRRDGDLKQDRNAGIVVAGHAFVQSLRRGPYELALEEPANRRLTVAFDELAPVI
jgi:hypothetical protein